MIKRLSMIVVLVAFVSLVVGAHQAVSVAAQDKGKQSVQKSPAQPSSEQQSELAKININKASAEELQKLPGIGPKIAEEIVKHRESKGPFKSVEDLVQVKGVGASKINRVRPRVTVE